MAFRFSWGLACLVVGAIVVNLAILAAAAWIVKRVFFG